MATDKKKKAVKVRDLKPSKDAKGGGSSTNAASTNAGSLSAKSDNALKAYSGASGASSGHN